MTLTNSQHQRHYPAPPNQIYLYGTCLADTLFPDSGIDAIEFLERQGIEVIYPQGQTCCGQPAYNSGYTKQARTVAKQQIKQFPLDIPIVVISGSCGGMMRHHYQELLDGEPEISQFCDRIFEFTEFLVNVLKIKLNDNGEPERVALHTSCAARREMGVHLTGRELLGQLEHVELVTHPYESECCGFGGTFSVKHGDISIAMVNDKSQHLAETGVVRYVSADWGCMMNINGALEYQGKSLRGEHIASYLLNRTQTKEQ
ncbi:(Fe-S)-binding protein [Psychrobium sp. 1_MG-2023]|uniref:(Fe-S)-binding protein n=1 Tax=Psychrobium sp. 1_MG-2023 TaxID=3062624 RepID=UPI000C34AB4A|nr:(Fe-S)-binding protein [Psychrobium sp. 1_MG-2023]MDP2559673.1 (Fe-S)-binding protein [Psychrobium sp. 1_MG-2023]PKF59504.1 oxidoreductase [Alteromonadales bacterium alter-6D02]